MKMQFSKVCCFNTRTSLLYNKGTRTSLCRTCDRVLNPAVVLFLCSTYAESAAREATAYASSEPSTVCVCV